MGCAGYHKIMVCAVLEIVTFLVGLMKFFSSLGVHVRNLLTCDVSSEESLSECEELENSNDVSDGPSSR